MRDDPAKGKMAGFVAIYCLSPPVEEMAQEMKAGRFPTQRLCTVEVNVLEDWEDPVSEMLQTAVDQARLQLPSFAPKFEGWDCFSITVIQIWGPHRTSMTSDHEHNVVTGEDPGDSRP